jgi:hypothetical protein
VISDRGEVRYWGRFDAMSQTEIDEVGAWLSTVRIDWANILPARD